MTNIYIATMNEYNADDAEFASINANDISRENALEFARTLAKQLEGIDLSKYECFDILIEDGEEIIEVSVNVETHKITETISKKADHPRF